MMTSQMEWFSYSSVPCNDGNKAAKVLQSLHGQFFLCRRAVDPK